MTVGRRHGWFVASEAAAQLSDAPQFQGERVPASALVTDDRLAVELTLPNGGHADLTASFSGDDGCYRSTSAIVLHDAAGGEHAVQHRWVADGDAFVLVFETAHAGDVVAGRLELETG
ncbi:MAG TPA: hypothetical protein VFW74_04470 [Acidimicrobiia bacterium]|nr:hypothetical protein [Acidimicrobiia bacterium]